MSYRALGGLLLLLKLGCASAPPSRPPPSPQARAQAGVRIQLVSDDGKPARERSRIGKAELDRARSRLDQARQQLEPDQWMELDRKLAEAERAWERFDAIAKETGKTAEVPQGPIPVVGLVGTATAETIATASALGPLMVALAALWPAATATATLTPLQAAELAFTARLQQVVRAAELVRIGPGASGPPPVGPAPPRRRPPECEPKPVSPHAGYDTIHATCADVVPPNRFPEHDVLVGGVLFDALQVGVDVLWEVKTARFDTYNDFIKDQMLADDVKQIDNEQKAALRCGYGFVVSVSSAAHAEALRRAFRNQLEVRLNECVR